MKLVVIIWLPPRALSATKFGEWVVIGCLHAFQGIMNYLLASSCIFLLQYGVVSNIFKGECSAAQEGICCDPSGVVLHFLAMYHIVVMYFLLPC